jgi:hypothetical protein
MSKCTCPKPSNWYVTWCSLCDGPSFMRHADAPPAVQPVDYTYIPTDQMPGELLITTTTGTSWLPVWPNTSQAAKPQPRPPLTDKQQQQASGIARAVGNLSRHEHRLGAARFSPEGV